MNKIIIIAEISDERNGVLEQVTEVFDTELWLTAKEMLTEKYIGNDIKILYCFSSLSSFCVFKNEFIQKFLDGVYSIYSQYPSMNNSKKNSL
jgi:hypothetical protein